MERVAHSRSCSLFHSMDVSPPQWESGPQGGCIPIGSSCVVSLSAPSNARGGQGAWLGFTSLPVEEDGHTAGPLCKYALTSVPWRTESMPSRVRHERGRSPLTLSPRGNSVLGLPAGSLGLQRWYQPAQDKIAYGVTEKDLGSKQWLETRKSLNSNAPFPHCIRICV